MHTNVNFNFKLILIYDDAKKACINFLLVGQCKLRKNVSCRANDKR